jgi:predicted naringenin-chalcone synthase
MGEAYINRIAAVVPPNDGHSAFLEFARLNLIRAGRNPELFKRMVERSGIEHRYSCLSLQTTPEGETVAGGGLFRRGSFPGTEARMRLFRQEAPPLAQSAVERVLPQRERASISHILITCCTGFSAPGLDFEIISRCALPSSVERTFIGFMGCYAAINALKLARHIVRSERGARVLIVNLELCSLHLQDTTAMEQILSFLLFADGCAASIVSAVPEGLALERFYAATIPDSAGLITWNIGDQGFDMVLSGKIPAVLREALPEKIGDILYGIPASSIDLWAVHPGGRSILDAVEHAFALPASALCVSRDILRRFGNMSSATVMFVLERMLTESPAGQLGCAMGFGPGVTAETMLFRTAGVHQA